MVSHPKGILIVLELAVLSLKCRDLEEEILQHILYASSLKKCLEPPESRQESHSIFNPMMIEHQILA